MEDFYREQDTALFSGPGVEADCFNVDALGKTLDRIYRVGSKKFFSALVARAMVEEDIAYRPKRYLELERALSMIGFDLNMFL